ncbi:MAG: DNA-processing protein DprA [bacterium]|nr:DNA-processing protein DprA [bacterium]
MDSIFNIHKVQHDIRKADRSTWGKDLPLLAQMTYPPRELFIRGEVPAQAITADDARNGSGHVYMTIVGSRKFTSYGKEVCETLIKGLCGLPVVIVSGLALGIDSIAHRAAIDAGLKTVAVPGSGIDDDSIYPASHLTLAQNILESGGAIISPFPSGMRGTNWMFPTRNRIMAGISHATLVIEADLKSGTLITSKHATEFNRDVFTVPGSIFSNQSAGPHQLMRSGATPIGDVAQLREALGFSDDVGRPAMNRNLTDIELRVLAELSSPKSIDSIIETLGISASEASVVVSSLEMKGIVKTDGQIVRMVD